MAALLQEDVLSNGWFINDEAEFHTQLAVNNAKRLLPTLPNRDWIVDVKVAAAAVFDEGLFVEGERRQVREAVASVPRTTPAFLEWFEDLSTSGPGQGDPLFPWLSSFASLPQMKWFLSQEAAGEAGFDDLVALGQVRSPRRAARALERDYGDAAARGQGRGVHALSLADVV